MVSVLVLPGLYLGNVFTLSSTQFGRGFWIRSLALPDLLSDLIITHQLGRACSVFEHHHIF
jgi:hypothetical protein